MPKLMNENMVQQSFAVLGASNVSLAWPAISNVFCKKIKPRQHIQLLGACGHGRSYGLESQILGRKLISIKDCGLFSFLEQDNSPLAAAILTDVGNDLLYGASPKEILQWVEFCLQALAKHTDHLHIVGLPMGAISKLGRARFAVMRRLLFPTHKISYESVNHGAVQLHSGLEELSRKYQTSWEEPPSHYYGLDPIHIRRKHRKPAWEGYIESALSQSQSSLSNAQSTKFSGISAIENLGLRPESWSLFGRARSSTQPCWQREGLSLSLY